VLELLLSNFDYGNDSTVGTRAFHKRKGNAIETEFSVNLAGQMKFTDKLSGKFRAPKLTRTRIVLALAIAALADGLQFLLGPFGWEFPDQAIDVLAMFLTMWVIGFHFLLLPTFVVEILPVADMLPTWTACVIAVIILRKREQNAAVAPPVKKERE
jgi:hypothetical protein